MMKGLLFSGLFIFVAPAALLVKTIAPLADAMILFLI